MIKNGHQKDMSSDEIGLCAQHIHIILVSIIDTIGKVDVMSIEILQFDMQENLHRMER